MIGAGPGVRVVGELRDPIVDTWSMTDQGAARSGAGGARGSSAGGPGRTRRLLAHIGSPNRVVAAGAIVLAVGLVPWIVLLGFTLPPRYEAGQWPLLWIGYDTAEVAVLVFVAWAAWYRRQILAPALLVAAVLLLVDAWFDILTSVGRPDWWVSVATGLGAEIPLAIFFVWLYRRLVLGSLRAYHKVADDGVVTSHLHDAPLVFRPSDEQKRARRHETGGGPT